MAERHEGDQFESLRQSTKHSSLALPAREYDGDLTETLKLRIAGAAFGVRKKERQKINDVFLSLAPGPGQTRENLNDDNQSRKLPQVSVTSVEMCDFPKLFGYCQLLRYLFHRTVHRIPTSCFYGL